MSAPRMHETWHPCTWRTCTLSRWGCAACSVMNISFTHTIPYPARERPLPRCSPVAKLRKCTGARERGSPNTHIHIHDEPITHSREKRAALTPLSLYLASRSKCVGNLLSRLLSGLLRYPARPRLYTGVWGWLSGFMCCVCCRVRARRVCARGDVGVRGGTWMSAPRMHETWHPCT